MNAAFPGVVGAPLAARIRQIGPRAGLLRPDRGLKPALPGRKQMQMGSTRAWIEVVFLIT